MKTHRKLLCLCCPVGGIGALEKLWKVKVRSEGAVGNSSLGWISWLVPFGVVAICQQVRAEDRHPIKYWMPYGKMCRLVAERYGYVVNRGTIEAAHDPRGFARTQAHEQAFSPFVRLVRRWSPYGLVLWWDRTENPLSKSASAARAVCAAKAPTGADYMREFRALSRQIKQLDDRARRAETALQSRLDNLEIQILKLRVQLKTPDVNP